MNQAALLSDAALHFQVGEHLFCSFFIFEWFVRFVSFAEKRDCLKDAWFMVDTVLAWLMVFETWVITLIFAVVGGTGESAGGIGNAAMLRILRLLRLTRMAR